MLLALIIYKVNFHIFRSLFDSWKKTIKSTFHIFHCIKIKFLCFICISICYYDIKYAIFELCKLLYMADWFSIHCKNFSIEKRERRFWRTQFFNWRYSIAQNVDCPYFSWKWTMNNGIKTSNFLLYYYLIKTYLL